MRYRKSLRTPFREIDQIIFAARTTNDEEERERLMEIVRTKIAELN